MGRVWCQNGLVANPKTDKNKKKLFLRRPLWLCRSMFVNHGLWASIMIWFTVYLAFTYEDIWIKVKFSYSILIIIYYVFFRFNNVII